MSSKKLSRSDMKRTSHYYKKKLSEPEEEDSIDEERVEKSESKIQKKPKEAKLRAKEARERKKKYIERLEEKIEFLEKELQKYKENQHLACKAIQSQHSAFIYLNINNNNKNNNINNNKPTTTKTTTTINRQESKEPISNETIPISEIKKPPSSEFTSEIVKLEGIQDAFRRLYKAVSERNENEAVYSVNMLRERFGVAGYERKNWISELVMKVVDIQMPLHCRLLLEHCENRNVFFLFQLGEEFYKLLGGSESLRQFRKVYFDQNTISTICQSRSTMMEIKQQYKRILLNLEQLSYEMQEQATKLQSEINRMESSMNPLFVGRILVYLDMERKETENLQEIFPVNFYKKALIECPEHRERMKYECDVDFCKEREDERLERLSMLSDEENFLKDFFSD